METGKGVATGIGHWFSDIGRSIVSDDPHQEGTLKTAIGYAAAKRRFAYEFGVDPYSNYEPVQEALNEIALAAVGGGMTPKVAFGLIEKPIGSALRATGTFDTMKKLVRDKSPAELEDINEEKLKAMGVHAAKSPDDGELPCQCIACSADCESQWSSLFTAERWGHCRAFPFGLCGLDGRIVAQRGGYL